MLLDEQTYTRPDGSPHRRISLLWRGFEGSLTTAYTGADGVTYFFFGDHYRRWVDGVLGAPTYWALESIGHVDAATSSGAAWCRAVRKAAKASPCGRRGQIFPSFPSLLITEIDQDGTVAR